MQRFTLSEENKWEINTFFSSLLAVFIAYSLIPTSDGIKLLGMYIPGICIFKEIFKIGCPVCCLSRSINSALHLDIVKAFFYHPLGLLVTVLILTVVFYRILTLLRLIPQLSFGKEVFLTKKINLYFLYAFIFSWVIRSFLL